MKRVVIFGPGASGKSTLAGRLGQITGLRVIELDKVFWQPGLVATPADEWVQVQQVLVNESGWIMDGDLGPYDAVGIRVRAADTIIFLDFPIALCAWRAFRRSPERADFWLWLWRYRRHSRPQLMQAFQNDGANATLHVLRNPAAVNRFLEAVNPSARNG